jgi:hypothetical protein
MDKQYNSQLYNHKLKIHKNINLHLIEKYIYIYDPTYQTVYGPNK